ncbi:MAG: cupredoxin domain-containing protein [Gaiellaceae bacterium]
MRRLALILALLALATAGVAACGGDDDDGEEAPTAPQPAEAPADEEAAQPVRVSADPTGALAFEQDSLRAEAGTVTVEFTNDATLGHDFRIEDAAGEDIGGTEVISESQASATLDLEPGEYTYYCSVPGHREGGMEGTLTAR